MSMHVPRHVCVARSSGAVFPWVFVSSLRSVVHEEMNSLKFPRASFCTGCADALAASWGWVAYRVCRSVNTVTGLAASPAATLGLAETGGATSPKSAVISSNERLLRAAMMW